MTQIPRRCRWAAVLRVGALLAFSACAGDKPPAEQAPPAEEGELLVKNQRDLVVIDMKTRTVR